MTDARQFENTALFRSAQSWKVREREIRRWARTGRERRALAEHSLNALGVQNRAPFVQGEMLRLFGVLAATTGHGPDRKHGLGLAIAAATSEYD